MQHSSAVGKQNVNEPVGSVSLWINFVLYKRILVENKVIFTQRRGNVILEKTGMSC